MKQPVRYVLRILLRLLILWTIDTIAMVITIDLLPNLIVIGEAVIVEAAAAALLLAIVNVLLSCSLSSVKRSCAPFYASPSQGSG